MTIILTLLAFALPTGLLLHALDEARAGDWHTVGGLIAATVPAFALAIFMVLAVS